MASGIFRDVTLHYPETAEDFASVKETLQDHGGSFVTQPHLATVRLLPPGAARAHPSGEFVDVSYVYDSIDAGHLLDVEEYIVSFSLPEPYAARRRLARDTRLTLNDAATRSRTRSPRGRELVPTPLRDTRLRPIDTLPKPLTPKAQVLPPPQPRSPEHRDRPISRREHPAIFRGRLFFTHEEDMRVIHLLESYRNTEGMSANGTNLWKKAASLKISGPGRSWQGYEGRYKKHMRNRWDYFFGEYTQWLRNNGFTKPNRPLPDEFWANLPPIVRNE